MAPAQHTLLIPLLTSLVLIFLINHSIQPTRAFPIPIQIPFSLSYQRATVGPVKELQKTEVEAFKPYTYYAATGYCDPSATRYWTCGKNCDQNPSYVPVASGGDGADVQYWFVGIDHDLETIIVGHEGTDPAKIVPLLTILDIQFEELTPDLFPGISPLIQVHGGFRKSHAKTALEVLDAVKQAITLTEFRKVTTVGHSLGAAIAILDSIYLPLFIPNITVHTVGFGTPRVGNWAFAEYVDKNANLTRVNNRRDPVPILPGLMLGYEHPGGERHIHSDGKWVSCSAHDNESEKCTTGEVNDIFEGDLRDHDGPYEGVVMDC